MANGVVRPLANSRLAKLMFLFAAFVIVVAGIRAASLILVPFLMAVFVAIVSTPMAIWMNRRGLPMPAALGVVIFLLVAIGVLGVGVIGKSVNDLTSNLSGYQSMYDSRVLALEDWLENRGLDAKDAQPIKELFNPAAAIGWVGNTLGALTGIMSQAFIILLLAIFMLLEAAILPEKVRRLPGMSDGGWGRLGKIVEDVRFYMGIKTLMSLLTGFVVGLWCWRMGVDFPILLGLLAFILNYVPNVGSILAAVPAMALALFEFDFATAAVVGVGYAVINITVSNFLEPRILGKSLGMSPLVILVSMFFWGWVLGPIGMLLAVPLTMTTKIAMESGRSTQWIAMMMAHGAELKAADPAPALPAESDVAESEA
ncbi:MAG: AI-2 transport protein TqsA [Candidatus Binatia bacterium]|jgi:AI-2 transport protein TqsA